MKGIAGYDAMDSEGNYWGSSDYYNPTQQFGTLDRYGNITPYDPWGRVTTPPYIGDGGTYGGGGTVPSFWQSLTTGIRSATSILGARYSVPQLNPGQVIQTGPGGTTYMSQAQAGGALQLPSSIGGMGMGTVLLIGGGILAVVMMSKSKGH